MTTKLTLAIALLVAGSGMALADHNSKWGEGTALDPMGIHDARIDSLDTAGEEPFGGSVDAGGGKPFDLLAFMRQGRPETILIEQGGSSEHGMSGGMSGHDDHDDHEERGGGSGRGNGGGGRH